MTLRGWAQILFFALVILAVTKPLGVYLWRVFEGERRPLARVFGPIERLHYRLLGVDPNKEQTWQAYALALLAFSMVSTLVTYGIQRLQHALPFNPQGFSSVAPALALNTAASFTTNTNWQAYSGESTMSYLSQMAGLAWHNFTSAAAGIGVALALARGLTRQKGPDGPKTLGSFWVDLVRSIVYVLLPLSIAFALLLVSQGVIQTLSPYREVTGLEGVKQIIALGPVASQEAIKQLGTNGGGFFNANAAHPFENPTPIANLMSMVLIFAIPSALTYTFGKMAGRQRQGWAILGAMAILFFAGVAVCYRAEAAPSRAMAAMAIDHAAGNMEGKETRFGVAGSALYATVTTDASCGAVNSVHDSYSPLGGLVPLANIELGEVVFGGVGAGLYGMLVFVLLSVFIAGLMVGRTPEYLGKKIEAREMKLAMLYVLVFPFIVLTMAAWAAVVPYGVSSLNNGGPHGLSEMLYAYSSAAGNNGSAFAGLNANTTFWNVTLAVTMLVGRFWMMLPVLGIAGAMVGKKTVVPGPGTFPTGGLLFTGLLTSVVLIVGALTYFPALCLGPIVEQYALQHGKVY
jgi:K+-transporting ATPase ATPase A chain